MAPCIKNIVRAWLERNGYDGLCNPELECGCEGGDLMACGEPHEMECVAAMEDPEKAEEYECDFWMTAAKPWDWECTQCGQRISNSEGFERWRWQGRWYEHKCPDAHPQSGHFVAEPIWERE